MTAGGRRPIRPGVRWRPARVLLVTLLAAVALGGCGVSTQTRPVPVEPDDVPFGLLRESKVDDPTPTTRITRPPVTPTTGAPQ